MFFTEKLYVYWNSMNDHEIINWLLEGDVSIQYQVYRDLLDRDRTDLQKRIETEGWGRVYLARRNAAGHWGRGYYQPKWTSTHYTLLDLRNLCISQECRPVKETLQNVLDTLKAYDGGINPGKTIHNSDVCINGMALNFMSYFGMEEHKLESIVDFLLGQHMQDGGFNCRSNRGGARHSSLHTTLSVLEGILEYRNAGFCYRIEEIASAEKDSLEFILEHRLYKSDKTGEVIHPKFLALPWPSRWKYDILRCLDFFQAAGYAYDERMEDAIGVLIKKRMPDGRWKLQAHHPGQRHFEMEKPGTPGRWNTLRAMRILKHFGK
jgi:hypothetical protein